MMPRRALSLSSAIALGITLLLAGRIAVSADDTSGLGEIVVTAQKYQSTVQSTPFSLSALSGQQLADAGIAGVEDLTRDVPGFSMRSAGPGQSEYEARGLASNGGSSPTVGFYLDEIPLSPPAASQTGKIVIDPDLYDLDRVELLRGPQGTLYGSGSMGGTIRLITAQPKLDTFEATIQGTLSSTQGGSVNGGGNAMVNLPLGNSMALRLVGSDAYRSGWIDRITLNPFPIESASNGHRGDILNAPIQSIARDANTERMYGGRASIRWQPSEDLGVVGMVLYQRMKMGGYDEFDVPPGADHLARYQPFPIAEPITDNVHVYGLTISANLGFADLTSATGYWDRAENQTQDASENFTWALALPSYISLPYPEIDLSNQFSQEIRLNSKGDGHDRLRWVVGAFYSDLKSDWIEYALNPVVTALSSPPSDNPQGIIFNGDNKYRMKQYAVFADGSYNITDTIKFSTGLRWYRYQSAQYEYLYIGGQPWGYYAPQLLFPAVAPGTQASNRGFNPRFNLSYAPSGDLTTYAAVAKGFRPGGANQITASFCGPAPTSFGPDSVWNYEIGEKAKMLDGRLTVNSDFYYIKWSDVQQTLFLACGYQYGANAGKGRSFGPELEVSAKLSPEWSVALSGTYTHAEVNSPSAAFAAQVAGQYRTCPTVSNCTAPILNVPKSTGTITLTYTTQVSDYQFTARVSDSYVGSSTDVSYTFVELPSYSLANAVLSLGSDKWTARLFVTNLTNKVAEISANNTSFQVNLPGVVRISTNQPRTFGTELNYRF